MAARGIRRLADRAYRGSIAANRLVSRALLERQNLRFRRPGGSPVRCDTTVAVDERLPRLSWLCRREGPRFEFTAGPGVEITERGLFEGAWTGDFTRLDQMPACLHFGSGAMFGANVLFIPPKHPLEHLYVLRDKRHGVDYVSNSLCFCLAAGGARRGTTMFERVAATIVESTHVATGLSVYRYDPVVVEDDAFTFLRILHNNFHLAANGTLRFSQPYLGRRFRSFGDYRAFLSASMVALFDNATHPARRTPLRPMTSVSSGYDSPAVAVLAREHGCREAVTIGAAVGGREDSGREIGEELGLAIREFPHVAGRRLDSLEMRFEGRLEEQAREFIATAGIGDDITFLAFAPVLASRLLLTGAWGDSIWAKGADVPPGIPVRVRFGKSLTEYRLRLGFAHAPIPFVGGIFPRSIVAISNSAEMAPYSIGGGYDRPIPRRIVESAGIARRRFGMSKVATAPDPLNHAALWSEAAEHVMQRYLGQGRIRGGR